MSSGTARFWSTLLVAWVAMGATLLAAPGDVLQSFLTPVQGGGYGIAADRDGNIYFANHNEAILYRIDSGGTLLGSVAITEAPLGTPMPMSVGALTWDNRRRTLWAMKKDFLSLIYRLDPATGLATFVFEANQSPCTAGAKTGLSYDCEDDTLWIMESTCPYMQRWTPAGVFLGRQTFHDAVGADYLGLTGHATAAGDIVYAADTYKKKVVSFRKSNGDFLADVATLPDILPGEVELDLVSFAPRVALWVREMFATPPPARELLAAIEVVPAAAACLYCPDLPIPSADAPPFLCGAATILLDGTLSGGCGAPGLEYRWDEGTSPVCDWSVNPTCVATPTATTVYTLRVRCADRRFCAAATSATVVVDPDIVPPDLANSLRAVRKNADVDLLWASVAEARSYSLFRGLVKGMWPPLPLVEDLLAPALALPDVAVPPNDPLYFYRAAGASCSGVEGP